MNRIKSSQEIQRAGNEVTDIKCVEFGTTLDGNRSLPNFELCFTYGGCEIWMAEDDDYDSQQIEKETLCRIYDENRERFSQAVIPVLQKMLDGEKISYGLPGSHQLELARDNHFVLYDNMIDDNLIAVIPYPAYGLAEIAQMINDWAYGRCNPIKGRGGIWSIYDEQ